MTDEVMKNVRKCFENNLDPYKKCFQRYSNSFTQQDGFGDKQFDRYVKKTKDYLFEVMQNTLPKQHKINTYEELVQADIILFFFFLTIENLSQGGNQLEILSNLDMGAFDKFITQKLGFQSKMPLENKQIEQQTESCDELENLQPQELCELTIPPISCFSKWVMDERKSRYKFDLIYSNDDLKYYHNLDAFGAFLIDAGEFKDSGLLHFVSEELRRACKERVRIHSISTHDMFPIEKSNYFKTLVDNPIEAYELHAIVFNRVLYSMENLFTRQTVSTCVSMMAEDQYQKMQKYLDSQTQAIELQQDLLNKKDLEIQKLKTELETKEHQVESFKANNQIKNEKDCKNALKRENNKLKLKYGLLLEKYNALKSTSDENLSACVDTEHETLKALDYDAKYVFIVGDRTNLKKQILSKFKNAAFIESGPQMKKLNVNQAECVIVMTNYVSHNIYLKVKEKCKNNNVHFVHCNNFNVELIEQLLINELCY